MVKFLFTRELADSEEVLESVNRYINSRMGTEDYCEICVHLPSILEELNYYSEKVNSTWQISAYTEIPTNSKVKKFIKKAIRKCVFWYANMLTEQQVEFNKEAVHCINEQNMLLKILSEQVMRQSDLLEKIMEEKKGKEGAGKNE